MPSHIEFLILLAAILRVWWIVPRRRFVDPRLEDLFERLHTIEKKIGLDYEAAERLSKAIREDT
jgi:hypothetical protein